jgi:hypothetical protein
VVTLRARRAGWASGALRSCRSTFAAGSDWALATGFTLRALRSDRSGRSGRASRPALADGALGTDGPLLALCALGAGWTNWAGRASLTGSAWRTLRSRRRGARRQRDHRDGSRNGHQLSHQHFPSAKEGLCPPQRSPGRHPPVSAGHVKKPDLLRMRPVEHIDRFGGTLQ